MIVYIGAFFIPGRVERFALEPAKANEYWRFVTYPFVHLNIIHLIENILSLGLIVFIAFELKTNFSDFSSTYLSSGFLSALPAIFLMSFIALGASNAIFGGFGLISQETKKYNIKAWIIILLLTIAIFINPITGFFSYGIENAQVISDFKQSIAHFSGFVFGIGFFFLLGKIKPILTMKKRYVLRGGS